MASSTWFARLHDTDQSHWRGKAVRVDRAIPINRACRKDKLSKLRKRKRKGKVNSHKECRRDKAEMPSHTSLSRLFSRQLSCWSRLDFDHLILFALKDRDLIPRRRSREDGRSMKCAWQHGLQPPCIAGHFVHAVIELKGYYCLLFGQINIKCGIEMHMFLTKQYQGDPRWRVWREFVGYKT